MEYGDPSSRRRPVKPGDVGVELFSSRQKNRGKTSSGVEINVLRNLSIKRGIYTSDQNPAFIFALHTAGARG